MKISYLVKLAGVVLAMSLLFWQSAFAGCGCEERDAQQEQEESDLREADPSRG